MASRLVLRGTRLRPSHKKAHHTDSVPKQETRKAGQARQSEDWSVRNFEPLPSFLPTNSFHISHSEFANSEPRTSSPLPPLRRFTRKSIWIQLHSPVIKMDSAERVLIISCVFVFPLDIVKTSRFWRPSRRIS